MTSTLPVQLTTEPQVIVHEPWYATVSAHLHEPKVVYVYARLALRSHDTDSWLAPMHAVLSSGRAVSMGPDEIEPDPDGAMGGSWTVKSWAVFLD